MEQFSVHPEAELNRRGIFGAFTWEAEANDVLGIPTDAVLRLDGADV